MELYKISAFSVNGQGGNPAGVAICDTMPSVEDMQRIAAEVGYSETAFVVQQDKPQHLRVRYFSPESEVPFCGHATIALGSVLADLHGLGRFELELNESKISVEASDRYGETLIALQSPPTQSRLLSDDEIASALALFGYARADLNMDLPPAFIGAGATHFMLSLNSRKKLSDMNYDLDEGRKFMNVHGLVTIMLIVADGKQNFHVRNAFASGGVLEDPATGAAAAAFSGYLRDQNWPHHGQIEIIQGEDMGAKSQISATISDAKGDSIRVSGATHRIS